jgi:hypothetical protein
MKLYNVFILFSIISLTSCDKNYPDIQPNQHTTITGQFYNQSNQETYSGIKIRISAIQKTWYLGDGGQIRIKFIGYVDSTLTDTNGKYKISFTTTGNASDYLMDYSDIPKNVYVTPFSPVNIDTLIGKTSIYNFDVFKN